MGDFHMGQVLAVASGKGGVGKTTITAGLAGALANRHKRVLAIDCDFGMRNLDLIMGLENRSIFDLGDALSGKRRLSECIVRHSDFGALFFLGAPVDEADGIVTAERLTRLVMQTQNAFDYIIFDCPAGVSQIHREIARVASGVLIVTTPERAAVRDADRAGQLIPSRVQRLIINRVVPEQIKNNGMMNIDRIIDATAIRLIGLIPQDPQVLLQTDRGEPVCSGPGKAGLAIANIAARIDGDQKPLYKFW